MLDGSLMICMCDAVPPFDFFELEFLDVLDFCLDFIECSIPSIS